MKKNNDKSIFTKIWLGCFALLLTVSVYGMFGQVKGTRADEVYGPPAPSELTNKKKLYGIYQFKHNVLLPQSYIKGSWSVNFNSNSIGMNKIKVFEDKCGPLFAYVNNYNSEIRVIKNSRSFIHPQTGRYTCSYPGNSIIADLSGEYGILEPDYLQMDFGTTGSLVLGDKYCTADFNPLGNCFWGEWQYYDSERFIEVLKESTYKVNACYSNGAATYWGHGSDYIDYTHVPILNNKNDCDKGIKVTFKVKYGNGILSYYTDHDVFNYDLEHYYNSTKNEVTLYLPTGTYNIMEDLGLSFLDNDYFNDGKVVYDINIALSDEWKIDYGKKIEYPANGAAGPPQVIDNNIIQSTHLVLDGTVSDIVCEAIIYNFDVDDEVVKVDFFVDGGSKVPTQYIVKGRTAKEPTKPTKLGYIFDYWSKTQIRPEKFNFNTKITSNLTLSAIWKDDPDTYRVILNEGCRYLDDYGEVVGSTVKEIKKVTVKKGEPLSKEHDLISGDEIFLGWSTSSSCNRDSNNLYNYSTPIPSDDYQLYAVWATGYTVTFDPNGGTLKDAAVVRIDYGDSLWRPNDPTLPGSDFKGWYLNGEPYIFSNNPITSDMTLVAQWKVKEKMYTIKYDANGGSYVPTDTIYVESVKGQTSLEYPRYLGYSFIGWSKTKGCPQGKVDYGRGVELGSKDNKKDITLYACWQVEDSEERCSLRSNPTTGDNNLVWLIILEIIAIGSLISYFVIKKRKNSNVT